MRPAAKPRRLRHRRNGRVLHQIPGHPRRCAPGGSRPAFVMSTLSVIPPRSRATISRHPMALVITVVHNPEDSRIRQRQIAALVAAGWQITYAAPFRAFGLEPPSESVGTGSGRLSCIDLPRAQGRDRIRAWHAARNLLSSLASDHDLVVVHDPEL